MVTQAGTGLARIAVVTANRRLDLALPEHLPLVSLLPAVLRHVDAEPTDGIAHGGWALRRTDGSSLDITRTLAAQQVRDGETLHLVPARTEWPEPAYDDLMEAVAAGARRRGLPWTPAATRLTGLLTAGALLLLGLAVLVTAAEPGWLSGAAALATATVLLAAGVLMSRAMADSLGGAVLAAIALPYAFAGGALILGAGERLATMGAPHLLLGAMILVLAGVVGLIGVGDASRVFVAAVTVGLGGAVAALGALGPFDPAGSAAVVVGLTTLLLPAMPLLAVRLGKMPMPTLPRTPEDLLRDDPQPSRDTIYQATARADEILTGLLFGAAVVTAVAVAVLVHSGTVGALLLAGVVTAAYLLRARLVPTVRYRLPLLGAGLVGLAVLLLGAAGDAAVVIRVALLLPAALLVAGLVVGAGVIYSRRAPSPRLARFGDGLDIVAQLAVVPLACAVLGLFGFMRAMGG
ncbi:type VII secretion integral membrane protein EccD [Solwaraspora sp. WMMD406]|uniref:type VII secretion integral membrane protein EccD n=1 Tax=Solwaraspora sp. WMMD406 TaxID=3016095 RepID=UPI002416989A|nr:type VII secretion integral membrane protein EccD [Solwaraspora sp. WMMD406]MDG4762752.1 type VII secretion integral membrane protein EccD [Solwaraspora sp. WMMD406]